MAIARTWSVAIGISAGLFLIIYAYHRFALPRPQADHAGRKPGERLPFVQIFRTYFQQPRIVAVIFFILVYRLGEAVLIKMAAPFLLDDPQNGGLGLPTATVGFIYGTIAVLGLTLGGILGGWVIARLGLRKCIWPMALLLNLPNAVYIYLAWAKPPIMIIGTLVAFEQFAYGFGFTALMVFMMYVARGEYKTSHFAISTGFMALGMMLPGMVSGYLQSALGYLNFFILVICLTVPSLAVIFFIPLQNQDDKDPAAASH